MDQYNDEYEKQYEENCKLLEEASHDFEEVSNSGNQNMDSATMSPAQIITMKRTADRKRKAEKISEKEEALEAATSNSKSDEE